jgi:hypothetical protein
MATKQADQLGHLGAHAHGSEADVRVGRDEDSEHLVNKGFVSCSGNTENPYNASCKQ